MIFQLSSDAQFEATSLEDAFEKLTLHFSSLLAQMLDDDAEEVGSILTSGEIRIQPYPFKEPHAVEWRSIRHGVVVSPPELNKDPSKLWESYFESKSLEPDILLTVCPNCGLPVTYTPSKETGS